MRGTITGWGKCLPPAVLSNDDIAGFLDTDDKWVRERTGIAERRISHVGVIELASVAGARAMACAGVTAEQIDAVILATTSPEILIPSSASRVQQALGIPGASAFDLNAGCTGFVYGLATANGLISSGVHKRILLIGAERLSFYLDWRDRNTAVLFGDGAGAVVLEEQGDDTGVMAASLHCDAEAGEILMIPDFGTAMDMSRKPKPLTLQFEGKEIFKRAVKGMCACLAEVADISGVSLADCDQLIPHQANQRIIEAVGKTLKLEPEQVMSNVAFYGNTSSATVPIALCEALEQGRVSSGANIFLTAFGAGLTRAAVMLRWGDRTVPVSESDRALPECEQTALELINEMRLYQVNFKS